MSQVDTTLPSPILRQAEAAKPVHPAALDLIRGPLLAGLLIVALFFGGFGSWAALAPLSSGAIASGVVSPESSRRVIQHLEGGIVRLIHVRENQHVAAGDPLITLESTRAQASFSADRGQWLRLLVTRARLDALAQGLDDMALPPEIVATEDAELLAFVEDQKALFLSQRGRLTQQASIAQRRIMQLNGEITAIQAENVGLATQLDLVKTDLVDAEQLLASQLIARSRVTDLMASKANLESRIAGNMAKLSSTGERIEEIRLDQLQYEGDFAITLASESTTTNNEIAVLERTLEASGDILDRTVITSPDDGIVLNLRNQTVGGVVRAGEPIMDIVPLDDDMIVLAKLKPQDIELVSVGMVARVSLLPFSSRNLLPLNGTVAAVAPDLRTDETTRQQYYEIRVSVPAQELAVHEGLYMSPGMPADVTVVAGSRTMLQYIAEPLLRSIRNAFIYD